MLLSIEVAVEYWLALTWSPQAQWLNELAKTGIIQDEVCTLASSQHRSASYRHVHVALTSSEASNGHEIVCCALFGHTL